MLHFYNAVFSQRCWFFTKMPQFSQQCCILTMLYFSQQCCVFQKMLHFSQQCCIFHNAVFHNNSVFLQFYIFHNNAVFFKIMLYFSQQCCIFHSSISRKHYYISLADLLFMHLRRLCKICLSYITWNFHRDEIFCSCWLQNNIWYKICYILVHYRPYTYQIYRYLIFISTGSCQPSVVSVLIIKPTRCTNFSNLFLE